MFTTRHIKWMPLMLSIWTLIMLILVGGHAHADALNNPSETSQAGPTGTKITIIKDNYNQFFKNTGLTSYDPSTGTVTFPLSVVTGNPATGSVTIAGKTYPTTRGSDGSYYAEVNGQKCFIYYNGGWYPFNWARVSGQSYMASNIDLHRSFEFKGVYNLTPGPTSRYGNMGDGVSFMFKTGDPSLLGIGGAGFGIGGLEGAFGFVIDGSPYGKPAAPSGHIPTIQMFETTGDNSEINTGNYDDPYEVDFVGPRDTSVSANDYVGSDKELPIDITWDAQTQTLNYKLFKSNSQTDILSEGSQNFTDYLNKHGYYASFAVASSNGGNQSTVKLTINSIEYSVIGIVNVDYLMKSDPTQKIIPTQQQRGSLTDTAVIKAYPNGVNSDTYRLVKVEAPDGYKLSGDLLTLPFDNGQALFPFSDVLQNLKLYYEKIDNPSNKMTATITHIDQNGKTIGKDQEITGVFGETVDIPKDAIPGFKLDANNPKTFRFGTLDENGNVAKIITLKYTKDNAPVPPTPTPTPKPTPNPGPTPAPLPTPNPSPTPQPNPQPQLPNYAAVKGSAVYALKSLNLYKQPTFSKTQRIATYIKKPRIYRPMFVVTNYSRSNTGKLRYKVRDVNHLSKTAGKTGFITARWDYVRPVYYQSKHTTLTVINPRGINAYQNVNLTGKVKNYKQGTILHVTRFAKHNLTTRYVLSNGQYITGNRKLVIMGTHKQPRYVLVKKSVNRYKTVNLRGINRHIKKGIRIKIKNYDFSYGHNVTKHSALRYHVAGGYITGNLKFIKPLN